MSNLYSFLAYKSGRQNMLWPYLKIWDWDWIFGRAVKAICSLGVRSPCYVLMKRRMTNSIKYVCVLIINDFILIKYVEKDCRGIIIYKLQFHSIINKSGTEIKQNLENWIISIAFLSFFIWSAKATYSNKNKNEAKQNKRNKIEIKNILNKKGCSCWWSCWCRLFYW